MNITGRITRDAVVRTTANDKQVVSFGIAVKAGSYRNSEGQRIMLTDFFDCAFWRNTTIAQYLTKGTLVELSGRVAARAWQDTDGAVRAGLNFNAREIILHGAGNRKDAPEAAADRPAEKGKTANAAQREDDLPF